MATREVRIPIKQKQFDLISGLQRAMQDLDRQTATALNAVIAGSDEALGTIQFRGLESKDGVFAIVLEEQVPDEEKPANPGPIRRGKVALEPK